MAAYSVATAALALGVPRKRLENLLARGRLSSSLPGRQGRSRYLRFPTIVAAAATFEMQDRLGIPAATAARLSEAALTSDSPGPGPGEIKLVRTGPVALGIDLEALQQSVEAGLQEAVQIAPRPARGRPPRKKRGHPEVPSSPTRDG